MLAVSLRVSGVKERASENASLFMQRGSSQPSQIQNRECSHESQPNTSVKLVAGEPTCSSSDRFVVEERGVCLRVPFSNKLYHIDKY